jgi:Mg2+ and Co2+ transporter CorA
MKANSPAKKSKSKSKSIWPALISAGLALPLVIGVIGVAQGEWRVNDKEVREHTKKIKEEVIEVRKEIRPAWNKGGNEGAYDPYKNRTKNYKPIEDSVTRNANQGMQARCGAVAVFNDADIWKVPDVPATDMASAQISALRTELCQRTVNAENKRFEQLLHIMSRMKQRNDALKRMAERRSQIAEIGQLDASTNNLEMFIADSQVEIQYMQATLASYDSLISTLKQTQDIVADRALNGKQTGPEQGMRVAALTTAIQAAKLF